ncbi:MAG: LysR family transcriptional regulator [Chloroflexi bacterium]|nr:LysR family transcriptional regulator [Chloroflexota bacterium]
MIEVHELEIFVAAAEEENFSAAARRLRLSQPAISFQVQALEQRLKVSLFQRTGRRIALSEAGRDLLPMARELIGLSARIEETMCAQQGVVKGRLNIGCSTSPGKYVLPHLIGAFRQQYPDVQFTVEVMDRQSVEEKLLTRQIQLGVLGLCSKSKELECCPLFMDELVLIVGANHPWATRALVTIPDLRAADWILREGGAATRQLVQSHLAEQGLDGADLRVAMELGSAEGVEAAVEAGHGVSFVSRVAVRRGLELGRIKQVPVEGVQVRRQIYLARSRSQSCTCAQLRFREFIASPQGQQVMESVLE